VLQESLIGAQSIRAEGKWNQHVEVM